MEEQAVGKVSAFAIFKWCQPLRYTNSRSLILARALPSISIADTFMGVLNFRQPAAVVSFHLVLVQCHHLFVYTLKFNANLGVNSALANSSFVIDNF